MTTYGPYQGTVVNIHDGDTIDVDIVLHGDPDRVLAIAGSRDIDLGFNVHLVVTKHGTVAATVIRRQSVRLLGINAPELSTQPGKVALAYIETLVKVGDRVTVIDEGWDKYGGRIDGRVTLQDGRDLSEAMVAANQAAPWDGQGTKPVPEAA